ncbi:hypothetical protein [Vagococcus xieshaowenii]|uniref:Uncharacterized protein n=1 Tax=Vagococcus xieshaowenii TaxID=2562451 RepID=A0AAJ5EDX4_9ENTE|nr:hypothetical protein [Vagococcus xieshaowenii]QCA29360.1 hypothetical protein E4Z98_08525 [Vagococcus xieshaowenii]TFZ39348.1 hypothetical protein E4031_09400 [Vagococcus xieshaowenii]
MTKKERLDFVTDRIGKKRIILRTRTEVLMEQLLEQPFMKEDLIIINRGASPAYLDGYLSYKSLDALKLFIQESSLIHEEDIHLSLNIGLSDLYPL